MRYIEAANSGGYQPTATQVTEWVFRSGRRLAQRGPLIEPAKPPTFPAAIGSHLADMVTGHLGQPKWMDNLALSELVAPARGLGERILANTGGTGSLYEQFLGTPARYGPGKPAETYIEHMIRMSWIDADDAGGLRLSPLGRALLRNDALTRQAQDEPSVIVLEADSPLSYAQLIGHIAGCGAAFVIDPYGRAEHLWRLIHDTTTVRMLIGPLQSKNDQDLIALRQTLASAVRPIEVRRAADGVLHDRFIIGDSGVMYSVGASWNSVGKHVTTIFQYPAAPADRLIDIAEQWWEEATPVEPAAPFPTQPPAGGSAEASAAESPSTAPKASAKPRRRGATMPRATVSDEKPPAANGQPPGAGTGRQRRRKPSAALRRTRRMVDLSPKAEDNARYLPGWSDANGRTDLGAPTSPPEPSSPFLVTACRANRGGSCDPPRPSRKTTAAQLRYVGILILLRSLSRLNISTGHADPLGPGRYRSPMATQSIEDYPHPGIRVIAHQGRLRS